METDDSVGFRCPNRCIGLLPFGAGAVFCSSRLKIRTETNPWWCGPVA